MEAVELVATHKVEELEYLFLAEEVARLIKHEPSPGIAGLVLYGTTIHHIVIGQLCQSLLGIEATGRGGIPNYDTIFLYLKFVALWGNLLVLPVLYFL